MISIIVVDIVKFFFHLSFGKIIFTNRYIIRGTITNSVINTSVLISLIIVEIIIEAYKTNNINRFFLSSLI